MQVGEGGGSSQEGGRAWEGRGRREERGSLEKEGIGEKRCWKEKRWEGGYRKRCERRSKKRGAGKRERGR